MPAPAIPRTEGELIEVFSSIQGEGLLVGCRQVFIRFARCNLDCRYCDTPFEPAAQCRFEESPGCGRFRSLPNPVALETLLTLLDPWFRRVPGLHHSISLTGGEPLLHAGLLAEWLPSLRRLAPLLLETNGTLPEALEPLLPHLDWIAMDIKLASVAGGPTPWEVHARFLALAATRQCQVKVVVAEETPTEEVAAAAELVRRTAPDVPLILQPLTRDGRAELRPETLFALQGAAAAIHPPVRVIPQVHAMLHLL